MFGCSPAPSAVSGVVAAVVPEEVSHFSPQNPGFEPRQWCLSWQRSLPRRKIAPHSAKDIERLHHVHW